MASINTIRAANAITLIAILVVALCSNLQTKGFADSPNLTISTKDQNGNPLLGYWIEVRQSGAIVKTGFSTASFTLSAGSYTVSVGDYGGQYFNKWSDGVTTRSHPFTVGSTGTVVLEAIYSISTTTTTPTTSSPPPASTTPSTTGPAIQVESFYLDNSPLAGMYTVLQQNGATIKTGFTPVTFSVTSGQSYTVTVSDYTNAYFNHWSDGTAVRSKQITAGSNATTIKSIYTTTQQPPPSSPSTGTPTTTPPPPSSTTGEKGLTISSKYTDNSPLVGMYITLSEGGKVIATGFTPKTFETVEGKTYTVTVSDYTNAYFNHWSDGTAVRSKQITMTSGLSLSAIFTKTSQPPPTSPAQTGNTGANTVQVTSSLLDGTRLDGEFVNVRLNGNIVAEGFTPVTFTLQPGQQYVVVVYWYGDDWFRHYSDGVLTRYHFVTPGQSQIALNAVYERVPSSQAVKLNVRAIDSSGNEIGGTTGSAEGSTLTAKPGIWMDLIPPGKSAAYTGAYTGSSSTPFTVFKDRTYTVVMMSYGQYQFDKWQDTGSTNPTRSFTMKSDSINNVAIYKIVATASATQETQSDTQTATGPYRSQPPYPWYDVDADK